MRNEDSLLQRMKINGYSEEELLAAATQWKSRRELIQIILESERIIADARTLWEYKSVELISREQFVANGSAPSVSTFC